MSAAIVMIHGRGPKPNAAMLLACWQSFLPAAVRGLPTSMVVWADLFGYDPPLLATPGVDCAHLAAYDLPDASAQALAAAQIVRTTPSQTLSGHAWDWPDLSEVKDRAMAHLWDSFVAISQNQFAIDVRNFFRDQPTMRSEARSRLKAAILKLRAAGHEVLVLAHSFGTIIAYEVARELQQFDIHTLITLGSPLAWCYDLYGPATPPPSPQYLAAKEFPRFGLRHWWNVYDPADLVVTGTFAAPAPQIAAVYGSTGHPVIIDAPITNSYRVAGALSSPHDYRGYLQAQPVQRALRLFMLEAGNNDH